ncbi:MAG: uridine kinase [Hyphomonadaceae bacterium]
MVRNEQRAYWRNTKFRIEGKTNDKSVATGKRPMQKTGLLAAIDNLKGKLDRPAIVALDGRSRVGKSTLANEIAANMQATVIRGDDFFAGGTEVRSDDAASRAAACVDWTRQRDVLIKLLHGESAQFRAFDRDAFDGRLHTEPTIVSPAPIIVLEGVYAARPELADLIDLRALLVVSDAVRSARLNAWEGEIGPYEKQWHDAEVYYFQNVMPEAEFDIVISEA